jgi:uncharacterized protein (TIGR00369 family)
MDGIDTIPGLSGMRFGGHGYRLGIRFHASGTDWAELALPWREELVGDVERGLLAAGPIVALVDMAASIAVWIRRGGFVPHATLDLRVDHLRPAASGRTVIGRGECYRLAGPVGFVRGLAHDGDAGDPIAHVVGTFMNLAGSSRS